MKAFYILTAFIGTMGTVVNAASFPPLPHNEITYRAPDHLPDWLKGHENLLPKVDPAVVQEMATVLNFQMMVRSEGLFL